jgi:AcrR family transcriptional regulator
MELYAPSAQGEILTSAISLFARKGYAGTGVQEILDAVGLSKPTLYYHFESKAGLFRAILDHAYDEVFRLMKLGIDSGSNTEEKLNGAALGLFEFTCSNQDLTRLVFATVFAAPEEVPASVLNPAKRRRNLDLLEEVLRRGQKTGEIGREYDVRDLTHGIFGAISHRIRTHLLTGERELNHGTAERIVTLFLNGARNGK